MKFKTQKKIAKFVKLVRLIQGQTLKSLVLQRTGHNLGYIDEVMEGTAFQFRVTEDNLKQKTTFDIISTGDEYQASNAHLTASLKARYDGSLAKGVVYLVRYNDNGVPKVILLSHSLFTALAGVDPLQPVQEKSRIAVADESFKQFQRIGEDSSGEQISDEVPYHAV